MTTDIPECLQEHPEVAEDYQTYLARKQASLSDGVRIAACGIYNAGKSSLLNVLAGQYEKGAEAFKTGAARVTSKVSELRVANVTLVDMPGVDGALLDDEQAWQGVLSGDCFFYVHRLMSSEFEQSEIEFLNRLKEQIRGLPDRLALVISQVDEILENSEVEARKERVHKAFSEIIGFEPRRVFPVSATRFAKGTVEGKQGMVERSGILALKQWVEELASPLSLEQRARFRKERLQTDKEALSSRIMAIADDLNTKVKNIETLRTARVQPFDLAARQLHKNLQASLKRIDAMD